jgi:hypothetical protein
MEVRNGSEAKNRRAINENEDRSKQENNGGKVTSATCCLLRKYLIHKIGFCSLVMLVTSTFVPAVFVSMVEI